MSDIFIFPLYILILFIIISFIFYRYKFYKALSLINKSLISLILSIATWILYSNLVQIIVTKLSSNLLLKGLFNTLVLFILILICIYVGFKFMNLLNSDNIKDNELTTSKKKLEHKCNIISKLRSQKHDYLKHLQVVYSLLNTGLNEDAKNYITNISNSFRSKNSRYGKVSYLDAIGSLKYEECLVKNISFDMYVQDFIDNLDIEPNEMSSVLLNIIDNAIDSLSDLSKNNKYIKVLAYEDEFQYIISIKNNGPKIYNTEMVFTEGFSTKSGQNRGYGLYLVKNILDKYGYYIFIDSDDFITEFNILIPKYI